MLTLGVEPREAVAGQSRLEVWSEVMSGVGRKRVDSVDGTIPKFGGLYGHPSSEDILGAQCHLL